MDKELRYKYEILEIDENCTLEDVKKSYRRLCLKYHPDKHNGDSQKFIEIKNAYEDIVKVKEQNINFLILFYYFILRFNKTTDITLTLKINIQDIFNSSIKKVTYQRLLQNMKKESCVFYLELAGYQEKYVIEDKGDYNLYGRNYGKLIINLDICNEGYEHLQLNKIVNLYDIYTTVVINLYEYYYGVDKFIKYFNNSQLHLSHNPYQLGDTQLIHHKGLPDINNEYGDLYVFYQVDLHKVDLNEESIKNMFNM